MRRDLEWSRCERIIPAGCGRSFNHPVPLANKRTRIVATLGPASDSPATLKALIAAGLNVVRINFSHAKYDIISRNIRLVREISEDLGTPVGILGDLRGPRIRVGEMTDGSIALRTGADVILTPQTLLGTPERIGVSFPKLAGDVEEGTFLLLDDGNLVLEVRERLAGDELRCRITQGGTLSNNRGINIPGRRVSLPSLTEKDLADVDFIVKEKFDFIALSFVQTADDVRALNSHLRALGADIPVIAQIEKKSALDDIDAIVGEAYGVMVARGDLALEMSLPEVPIAQKKIINACRTTATPVITATQMLESMTHNHKPTRAEVTDVANAILDGTDAVMLSGESAIGKYPVEAVATMAAIARRTEEALDRGELGRLTEPQQVDSLRSSVGQANRDISRRMKCAAMVVYTLSGATARWVLSHRPETPVLALCPTNAIRRRLTLSWGARSRLVPAVETLREMRQAALEAVVAEGLAKSGDLVTISAGQPFGEPDNTNLLMIERVP